MAYLCKPRVRSMRLLRGPSLCASNVSPLVHTPPWRWAPSLSGYHPGCARVQSWADRSGSLIPDRATEGVLEAPGDALDQPLDVPLAKGPRCGPEYQPDGEGLLALPGLLAAVEIEQGQRLEVFPGCRPDLALNIGVGRGLIDHDGEVTKRRGEPRRRDHAWGPRRLPPGRQVDLRDEGLDRQIPHLGDPRVELTQDQVRSTSVGEGDAPSWMKAGRVSAIADDLHVEKLREPGHDPLQVARVEPTLRHEPRLAILHRLRVPREEDADGPALFREGGAGGRVFGWAAGRSRRSGPPLRRCLRRSRCRSVLPAVSRRGCRRPRPP